MQASGRRRIRLAGAALMVVGLAMLAIFGFDNQPSRAGAAEALERAARSDPAEVERRVVAALDASVPAIRNSGDFNPETVRLAARALTVMFASETARDGALSAMAVAVNAALGRAGIALDDPCVVKVNELARLHLQGTPS